MNPDNQKYFVNLLWSKFRDAVVPKDAPPHQFEEMRRAFYSGGWTVFELVIAASKNMSEEEAEKVLNGIDEEFKEFFRTVGNIS